jgi:hypothetical protein
MTEKLTSNPKIHFDGEIKPHENFENISREEKFHEFKEELRNEYGEEFVLTVIGFSKEKYQEITPFGVNYEKNIREFVKTYPYYSNELKQVYEKATGKPHKLIEKALAQNEYLSRIYPDNQIKKTDETIPEEKRVYYDPDGYPNLQIDPTFYKFVTEKQSAGITSKQEILLLFSKEFPEKSQGYKVSLPNSERWEIKGNKSERLAEIITEQGVEVVSKTIDCNGVPVETLVFNSEPTSEKMVRVYRGVVSADQTILRQLPYAARGAIEVSDPNPDSRNNFLISTISEVPDVADLVNEIAKNPSMEMLLKYAEIMRAYFKEHNLTTDLEYLENTLSKFAQGIIEGTSLEAMLSLEQVSGGMYTAQYLLAPYLSATPKFEEAWTYGRGGVIVYDIPESELKSLSSRSECMMNGIIDEKYIKMFVFNSSRVSNSSEVETAISAQLEGDVYSKEELDEVGDRVLSTRISKENEKLSENLNISVRLLLENYANKFPLAQINSQEFLGEIENIDLNDTTSALKSFNEIKDKISQRYIEFILNISEVLEISPNIIKRELERETNLEYVVSNFFRRFETKKDVLNDRLSDYLPELKIDFDLLVQTAIKNKSSINSEIYLIIKNYCEENQLEIPQALENSYGQ